MNIWNSLLDWLNSPAFHAFGAPTSWAEVLGFLFGAATVWLVAVQNIWNWPVGMTRNALWILLFTTAGLYADAGLQVFFIVVSLWGWYQWLHVNRKRADRKVAKTSQFEWGGIIIGGITAIAFLTWFLDTQTNSTVPLADATTTGLSLIATYGQARKLVESWFIWIAADLIYIPLYHHKGLTLTAILYVGFLALCVKGYVEWRRDLRTQTSSPTGSPNTPLDTNEPLTADEVAA